MVLLDRKLMGKKNWYGVYSNNEMASFQCCEMLIKNGSDQIAYLSGPLDMSTSQERMNGYNLALRQRRWMDYDDQMIYAKTILENYPDIP